MAIFDYRLIPPCPQQWLPIMVETLQIQYRMVIPQVLDCLFFWNLVLEILCIRIFYFFSTTLWCCWVLPWAFADSITGCIAECLCPFNVQILPSIWRVLLMMARAGWLLATSLLKTHTHTHLASNPSTLRDLYKNYFPLG